MKGGVSMEGTLVLDRNEFEMPEDSKLSKVFDRLMKVNAAVTENGLHEVYSERHDQYSESYGIGFF